MLQSDVTIGSTLPKRRNTRTSLRVTPHTCTINFHLAIDREIVHVHSEAVHVSRTRGCEGEIGDVYEYDVQSGQSTGAGD